MRFLVVLAALVGCYSPNAPAGAPCGEGEACPIGQSCRAGYCRAGDEVDADPSQLDGGDDASLLDSPIDSPQTCAGGDTVCLVACVATDPDCTTTCGDNRCVGNAGELCGNCTADCARTATVCGNAECEGGESPDCFADCGPVPWTWLTEEQQLITLINNARTAGTPCPGAAGVIRPAYTIDPTMTAGAREWIWEVSHHGFFSAGNGCSGRTYEQRKIDGNFTGYALGTGYTTVQAAFDVWMTSNSLCPVVMSAVATRMNVSVSFDTTRSYVMVIR